MRSREASAIDKPARGGFTLVELLVVMAIIAVLVALLAAGIMTWVSGQSRRNTENEIRSVFNALMRHWDVVSAEAKAEPLPSNFPANRTRADWVQARLIEAFPISFAEVNDNYSQSPVNLIPADRRKHRAGYKQQINSRVAVKTAAQTESAACLLMALSLDRGGGRLEADAIQSFIKDSDGDNIPELVDGWGEPLVFYRFVSDNPDINAIRQLAKTTGMTAGAIVSGGPDLKLGHSLPPNTTPTETNMKNQSMTILSSQEIDDNIYSYKLK